VWMAEQGPWLPVLAFSVIALIVALGVGLGRYFRAKRRKMLALWAQSKGLSFAPAREYGLARRFAEFDCLRQGDNQYAYNVMSGAWAGRPCLAFDYHYQTYETDSKGNRETHHHHFSALVLHPDLPLKPLFIRPENFLDRLAAAFGFEDINFESAEFSRRFHVKAPDRKWAYDVISQRTMEFLLAQPQFAIKFDPHGVIAYRSKRFSTADFEAAASAIAGVLDRLPEYVIQAQRGNP
jgi:hypothetical protein